VPELQRLRADHAPAVLAFELANRAYFAASVSDRGDEFYDQFIERHNALLAEQEAGIGAFYVLVTEDGSVLGRFNLYGLQDGTAELGYRVAERVAGCVLKQDHRAHRNEYTLLTLNGRTLLPPIGCFVWPACHDQAVGGGVPANSRHTMLPADVAVRLQPGSPEESVAGGLQAQSGHDAGAYW
jgi:hypothetical protein